MEKLIEEILENFDFDIVKKVMEAVDWTYFDSEEVPTTYRLIKTARERLEDAYNMAIERKKDCNSSCGGFKVFAGYVEEKETVTYLELNFVVTSWEASI